MSYGNIIYCDNVNEALPLGLQLVKEQGVPTESRGIPVIEVPGPVMTVYRAPWERVLFDPVRNANPYFHFFEALWILAGAKSVHLPEFFLPRIRQYSDGDGVFHGAYGHRLRFAHGLDQIGVAIATLRQRPDTRQVVLSIWKPIDDLGAHSKDIPCNDMITFKLRNGRLDMTVFNRSNDVIWGAYGANAVQFSVLQEYVAAMVGAEMGHYTQVSDSFHVYPDNPFWQQYINGYHPGGHVANPYHDIMVEPTSLFHDAEEAQRVVDDAILLNGLAEAGVLPRAVLGSASQEFKSYTFRKTAIPMIVSYLNYRNGDLRGARQAAERINGEDWRRACVAWVQRREASK